MNETEYPILTIAIFVTLTAAGQTAGMDGRSPRMSEDVDAAWRFSIATGSLSAPWAQRSR
jgi:hypothetical protein